MSFFKRKKFLEDIVLDASTEISTVRVNGMLMQFETDEEAEFVFDLLNDTRDELARLKKKVDHLGGLARTIAHQAEEE